MGNEVEGVSWRRLIMEGPDSLGFGFGFGFLYDKCDHDESRRTDQHFWAKMSE